MKNFVCDRTSDSEIDTDVDINIHKSTVDKYAARIDRVVSGMQATPSLMTVPASAV